jgi:hypothetical protein
VRGAPGAHTRSDACEERASNGRNQRGSRTLRLCRRCAMSKTKIEETRPASGSLRASRVQGRRNPRHALARRKNRDDRLGYEEPEQEALSANEAGNWSKTERQRPSKIESVPGASCSLERSRHRLNRTRRALATKNQRGKMDLEQKNGQHKTRLKKEQSNQEKIQSTEVTCSLH